MPNASLPISLFINASATIAAAAAQSQSTQTALFLVDDPLIDVVTRFETFASAAAVAQQCGSDSPAAAAATAWYGQSPQPPAGSFNLGRWAHAASAGQLFGAPLSAAQQLIATWQAVNAGAFDITVDGGVAQSISGLDFSAAGNLNAVAAAIGAKLTGATIVWDALNSRFVVTSDTTGATSTVSFASAPGAGTDISGMLGMRVTSSGAYQADGIAAETALAAVTLFDQKYGQQWFGLYILGASDADVQAVGPFIAASGNEHYFMATTQAAGTIVSSDTTDLAYLMAQAKPAKTALQYSSSSPYAAASMLARILSVDYTGTDTAIILMYKDEPGIVPEALTADQYATLKAKNCNALVSFSNGTSGLVTGVGCDGTWIDTQIGTSAFKLALQNAFFNTLKTMSTKVAQTDAGQHKINVALTQVCQQFVNNGFLAPGVWNGPLFGSLQNNPDGTPPTLTSGFYVYQPLVSDQSQADRDARVSVAFQIAAKLAGGVQTGSVLITVNP